jgi:hydroxymethylpyrimidine/phosphomethylpyrimidine kinase
VLIKGGHSSGDLCTDLLVTRKGATVFEARRIATRNTHGTGCTYASAIAAHLANGHTLEPAVRASHAWLQKAILAADALRIGSGQGPVHHFHEMWQ